MDPVESTESEGVFAPTPVLVPAPPQHDPTVHYTDSPNQAKNPWLLQTLFALLGLIGKRVSDALADQEDLMPVGRVMAGVRTYHSILGSFADGSGPMHFRFRCTHRDCDGKGLCCREGEHVVQIE